LFAASILRVMTLFIAALATGALMVNWIGLARAMLRLSSASAYVGLHQATNRTFDPYMPTVVIGALLGGVVLAALSPGLRSPSGQLAVLGALCYAAVMMTSLSTNVRINRQVARWSASNPPNDWAVLRALGPVSHPAHAGFGSCSRVLSVFRPAPSHLTRRPA
jgi:hypothetical protein